MKKIVLIFLSLLLFLNNSKILSQENFKEGYIIKLNMDTVKGYIDYNNDQYYSCKFKRDLNEKEEIFKPTEIYGYRFINDKFFVSKMVTIRKSYTKNEETAYDRPMDDRYISKVWYSDSGKISENVFIEYLINGKLNIYFFKDKNNKPHYFASKENDKLYDLTQELIVFYSDGNVFSQKYSTSYQGILLSLMSDYPQLRNEILSTKIDHKDFIKVAKKYHQYVCSDTSCIIYARELKKVQIKFSVSVGLGYSETNILKINSLYNQTMKSPNFTDNHYLNIGVDLHILNSIPQLENTSFKIGFDFCKNKYSNNYFFNELLPFKDTSITRYYEKYNIGCNVKLIQKLFSSKRTPYIGIGVCGLYSFGEIYKDFTSDYKWYNYSVSKDSYNQIYYGMSFSLGYEWILTNSKHIYVEVQHKQYYVESGSQFNSLLLMGYEF